MKNEQNVLDGFLYVTSEMLLHENTLIYFFCNEMNVICITYLSRRFLDIFFWEFFPHFIQLETNYAGRASGISIIFISSNHLNQLLQF